jgi:group I intron endonuclease
VATPKMSGIYEIVNLVNGKRYVGSAVNLSLRWRQHLRGLRAKQHANRHLQSSFDKHGEASFEFRVIEMCDTGALIDQEQAAIDRLNPAFNICQTAGSTRGRVHTGETKAKIGARLRGSKRDPLVVEGIAAQLRGRSRPDLSARLVGNEHAKGHQHTDEWKAASSERLCRQYEDGTRGRDRPPEYREKIAATLREKAKADPDLRARLRQQATDAWAGRSEEERLRHMVKVRAARGPITDEQRRAISERQVGRPMSPKAAAALLAANKGRKLSDDHRRKISENNRKSWTPERKVKQAAAIKAFHASRRQAKRSE